ncbi:MAG: hypothetical protein LQ351_004214 [Letrouitia transgressa]|nr:MAG: hypothetical protein LQ351_004214 [Letrouitia transgressa]
MGAITDPAAWTDSSVGQMPACIEIKLVSVPELGYLASATPRPQGEIWIRGGAVTEGYLDLPDENRDDFAGGWFKTGDIGEFDEDGRLSVIDRKKNLVKTLSGDTTKDDPNLHSRLLSSLQQTGKTGGLAGIEIIDRIIIAAEEWTAQNGLTTSAQKLNRRAITGKYQKEIDEAVGGPK